MICPNCNKVIKDGAKFCGHCGSDILLSKNSITEDTLEEILARAFELLSSETYDEAHELLDRASQRDSKNTQVFLGKLLYDLKLHNEYELSQCSIEFGDNINYRSLLLYADEETKARFSSYQKEASDKAILLEKDNKYKSACHLMEEGSFSKAIEIFQGLDDWKDSTERIQLCNESIERVRLEEEQRSKRAKRIAAVVLPVLAVFIVFAIVYSSYIVPETNYKKAKSLYTEGNYIAAAEAMSALDGYKDSKRLEADYYFKAKDFIKAVECYRYLPDCTQEYNQSRYNHAIDLYDEKQYNEALTEFSYLSDFMDSEDYVKKCNIGLLKSSSPGYTFEFGTYEQDNDTSNGKEDITWIVAKNEGDKLLLVASNVLDCQVFDYSTQSYTPWKQTRLRNWLNNTFYNNAFNSEEKTKILLSEIETIDSGSMSSISNDYVFILSDDEFDEYNSISGIYHPTVTDYAKAQDDRDDDISNGWASWYTRDQGKFSGWVGYHYAPGSIDSKGRCYHVFSGDHTGGIRPCIWLDLSDTD